MSVCMNVCMCAYMCSTFTQTHACRGQGYKLPRVSSCIVLCLSPLRRGCSLNCKLPVYGWLDGQWALGIYLFLPHSTMGIAAITMVSMCGNLNSGTHVYAVLLSSEPPPVSETGVPTKLVRECLATLFILTKRWKQSRCLLNGKWMNKYGTSTQWNIIKS